VYGSIRKRVKQRKHDGSLLGVTFFAWEDSSVKFLYRSLCAKKCSELVHKGEDMALYKSRNRLKPLGYMVVNLPYLTAYLFAFSKEGFLNKLARWSVLLHIVRARTHR